MIDSKSEGDKNIERFKEAIRRQWKLDGELSGEVPCDLSSKGYGKGNVFIFQLLGQLEEYPEAKQCFVWDGAKFKPDCNETVVALDVQVIEHKQARLPEVAVWLWVKGLLKTCIDVYEKSKWTKDDLDGFTVKFHQFNPLPIEGEYTTGRFFVRERSDGKIAVRIVLSNDDSFCLNSNQIERIKRLPNSAEFWLTTR